MKRGWGALYVAVSLVGGLHPAGAQQSESFQLQTSIFAQAGGAALSAGFRVDDAAIGQAIVGRAQGGAFGTDIGFVNLQVVDFSPPSLPMVSDGLGEEADETTDNSRLCASWSTADLESGIFGEWLRIGSSPGGEDQVPATIVYPLDSACVDGPFDRCNTYYVSVESRNGSGLRSGSGSSNGVFIDDPVDADGDGLGNECDADDDGDGVEDLEDSCPCDPQDDADADGLCGNLPLCVPEDNCPDDYNPGQADQDGDGRGDACEEQCRVHVDDDAGGGIDCAEIQQCVDRARSGCLVLVGPGQYDENVVIDKPLTVEGLAGAEQTTLNGGGAAPAVEIDAAGQPGVVKIVGLEIAGGSGGVRSASQTEIVDSRIVGAGVGVHVVSGSGGAGQRLKLLRTTVEGGSTGILLEAGTGELEDSVVQGCAIGAHVDARSLIVDRSSIRGGSGTGVQVAGGGLVLRNSLVVDNGTACLEIGGSATARIEFATLAGCLVGLDFQNTAHDSLSMYDSIVHGNGVADLMGVDCAQLQRVTTAADCCGVNGSLCADPDFVDPPAGDYRLAAGSPCVDSAIDAGAFTGSPCIDRDGNPRLMDGDSDGTAHADMGAYESAPPPQPGPPKIDNLRFTDGATLAWELDAAAETYVVLVKALSDLEYYAPWDCLGTTDADFFPLPAGDPPAGGGNGYLVAGEDGGGQRGPMSDGTCAGRSSDAVCP